MFEFKNVCIAFEIITAPVMATNMTLRSNRNPHKRSKDTAFSVFTNMGFTRGSKFAASFSQIVGSYGIREIFASGRMMLTTLVALKALYC